MWRVKKRTGKHILLIAIATGLAPVNPLQAYRSETYHFLLCKRHYFHAAAQKTKARFPLTCFAAADDRFDHRKI